MAAVRGQKHSDSGLEITQDLGKGRCLKLLGFAAEQMVELWTSAPLCLSPAGVLKASDQHPVKYGSARVLRYSLGMKFMVCN